MPLAQTSRSGPPSSAAAPSPRQSSNAKVSSLSVWACETTASRATWCCWSLKIVEATRRKQKLMILLTSREPALTSETPWRRD